LGAIAADQLEVKVLGEMLNMFGIEPTKWTAIKKWMVIQKFTLLRGYGWTQVPMIGFIAASQFKLLFPTFFDGLWRFIGMIILATFALWFIGYLDKKMKLLHVENAYGTETNPMMMELLDNTKQNKDRQTN